MLTAEPVYSVEYKDLLLRHEIRENGVYVGWVETELDRVCVSGEDGAWAEITLRRRRRSPLAAWRAARKLYADTPRAKREDGREIFGTFVEG